MEVISGKLQIYIRIGLGEARNGYCCFALVRNRVWKNPEFGLKYCKGVRIRATLQKLWGIPSPDSRAHTNAQIINQ